MKQLNIAFLILVIVFGFFTVQYFFNPKKVDIPTIPDISADFEPSPPDTVWIIRELTEDEMEVANAYLEETESVENMLAHRKTFRESLMDVDVESEVIAYSPFPVYLLENNIDIKFDNERFQERVNVALSEAKKNSLKNGIIIGAAVTAALIVAGMIIAN